MIQKHPLFLVLIASLAASGPALARMPADHAREDAAGERVSRRPAMRLTQSPPRQVTDQEHARWRREAGEIRPLDELLARASRVGQGEYLGVEPDVSSNIYRFKFMRPTGKVVWVDVDSRSGRVIAERP